MGRLQVRWILPLALICGMLHGCASVDVSPDGRRLALGWYPLQSSAAVCIVDRTGKNFRVLSGTEDGMYPRWSPDGHRLAFVVYPTNFTMNPRLNATGGASELHLYDLKQQRATLLARNAGWPFTWSPDGHWIAAIAAAPAGNSAVLRVIRLPSGQESARIVLPCDLVASLIWVPGTRSIAVLGMAATASHTTSLEQIGDLYIDDGKRVRRITTSGRVIGIGGTTHTVLWAYESSNRAYLRAVRLDERTGLRSVSPYRIGLWPGSSRIRGWRSCVLGAAFSPDGRWLAFVVGRGPSYLRPTDLHYMDLCVARVDGTDSRLIKRADVPPESRHTSGYTSPPGPQIYPCWSPDSKWLAVDYQKAAGDPSKLTDAAFMHSRSVFVYDLSTRSLSSLKFRK